MEALVRPSPAGIELAVMFPPDSGLKGACTTVEDLSKMDWVSERYRRQRALALIMRHAFECHQSDGHGNKAARREALCATMSDQSLSRAMGERDARMHADLCFDRSTESRSFPTHPNPHDD